MELDARTSLQNYYRLVIIKRRHKDLEKLKEQAIQYLSSVPFKDKFVSVPFEELLQTIISRTQARKAEDFLKIQQGFAGLEKYGLKLFMFPWRKEFHTIKLYSSYFKHNVETSIPIIVASPLLKLYGYTEASAEILELKKSSPSSSTLETAFELYLSTIELEILYKIARDVNDRVTLKEVLKSRVETTGDVRQAKLYLFKVYGSTFKRIKLDGNADHGEQKLSKISEKDSNITYPPDDTRARPDQISSSKNFSSGNVRLQLSSATNGVIDKLSDSELYGVYQDTGINPAPTFANHYPQHMEIDDDDIYEPMNERTSYNNYEHMNALPKPQQLPPPPNYSQAVDPNFPGNLTEWVVVPEPLKSDHDIPGMSGLKIDENSSFQGVEVHTFISSNGVEDVGKLYTNVANLKNVKSAPAAFRQERMGSTGYEPSEWMDVETAKGISVPSAMTSTLSHAKEPSNATQTVSYSQASNSEKYYYIGKNDEFMKGFEKHQEQSRLHSEPAMSTKTSKDKQGINYTKLANLTSNQKSSSLSSNSAETLPSSLVKERSISTRYQTTANGILTPLGTNTGIAQSSRRTKTEAVLSNQKQTALPRESQETNQAKESASCLLCGKEASDMCGLCNQMACEKCMGYLNGSSCGDTSPSALPTVHQLQKVKNSKEKQPTSEDLEKCHYCTKPSTHKCYVCHKKSCNICHLLKHDDCKSSLGHIFTSITSREVSISDMEILNELNESNICDICRLKATFICGDCHNRTCKSCMKIYEKDLCSKTKKAHYFHLISSQTKIDPKEKPWSCGRCTFSNPPQNKICAMCATSQGVTEVQYPQSGSRKCKYCTYGNAEFSRICEMCSRSLDTDTAESYI